MAAEKLNICSLMKLSENNKQIYFLISTQHSVHRRVKGLWCLMPLSTIFHLYRGCRVVLVEEIRD